MNDVAFDKAVRDILVNLSDGDSYPLLSLTEDARFWLNKTGSDESAQSLVRRVVSHLLRDKMMLVGKIGPPKGAFSPFTLSPDALVEMIAASWELDATLPRQAMSDIWLLGTPAGVARGKDLIPDLNADPDIDA